jgi:thioredoxin-related protein
MMVGLKLVLNSLFFTLILVSCSNTKNDLAAVAPEPAQSSSEESNGKVKIETFVGAEGPEKGSSSRELADNEINWLDFEEAIDRNKENRKPIFIYAYTNWCTYCTKMNGSTFLDKSVVDYISANFYAVKVNPEEKKAIAYKEVLYEPKLFGNKMYNELIYSLMNGKMVFPSFIVLNKREVKRELVSGYQSPQNLLNLLTQYAD